MRAGGAHSNAHSLSAHPLLFPQVAYSFDAGPNAVIFTLEHTLPEFLAVVMHSFPPEANGDKYVVVPDWGAVSDGCPAVPGALNP